MIWNAQNESKCIKIFKNLLLNWDNNLPNDTILNAHRYDIEISNVLRIVVLRSSNHKYLFVLFKLFWLGGSKVNVSSTSSRSWKLGEK